MKNTPFLLLLALACQKPTPEPAPGLVGRWTSTTLTLLNRNQQTGEEKILKTAAWEGVIVLEVRADSTYAFARSKPAEATFGYDLGVFLSGQSGRVRKGYNVFKGEDQYNFANGTYSENLAENVLRLRSGYGGGGGGPITYVQADLVRER